MALTSTVHVVDLSLSDVDRGVYDTLALTVARHPSETLEHLVACVLGYALELEEGIGLSPGLCAADEPAVHVRDLTGRRTAWIDVGTPDADRLHRASKSTDRVAVYCHKEPGAWLRGLAKARVHRAEAIALWALDRQLVGFLAERTARRTAWSVTRAEGVLYVGVGEETWEAPLERLAWPVG
jgi:uncharacterized protein YaeQ